MKGSLSNHASPVGFRGYYSGRWVTLIGPQNHPHSSLPLAPTNHIQSSLSTLLRGHVWSIKYIFICSDNPTAIDVINKGHSQSLNITKFLRHLTLISMNKTCHSNLRKLHYLLTLSVFIQQIQTPGSRLRCSPNASPSIFSHRLHLNPQLLHLVFASQQAISRNPFGLIFCTITKL